MMQRFRIKEYLINLSLLFLSTLICLVGLEIMLRIHGYEPYRLRPVGNLVIEPGGRLHQNHPTLGYTHIAGNYQAIFSDGYVAYGTHLSNTLRVTHPISTYLSDSQKEEIWIFGGSFTYGWSLSDEETYPWLIQEKFPEYEVINFGVGGYGSVHSYLQFQAALDEGRRPAVAILAYADFHDERNSFKRTWRKRMLSYDTPFYLKTYPYARLGHNGEVFYFVDNIEYWKPPLMNYSALIHLTENTFNAYEDQWVHSHQVSRKVIKAFAELAETYDILFVLAGIVHGSIKMVEYAQDQGVMAVDISVDLDQPKYRNLPHDTHPSASANQQYAEKLGCFLQPILGQK